MPFIHNILLGIKALQCQSSSGLVKVLTAMQKVGVRVNSLLLEVGNNHKRLLTVDAVRHKEAYVK